MMSDGPVGRPVPAPAHASVAQARAAEKKARARSASKARKIARNAAIAGGAVLASPAAVMAGFAAMAKGANAPAAASTAPAAADESMDGEANGERGARHGRIAAIQQAKQLKTKLKTLKHARYTQSVHCNANANAPPPAPDIGRAAARVLCGPLRACVHVRVFTSLQAPTR
jgi:hypothetical protein